MSLSTITAGDLPPKRKLFVRPEMNSLKTHDIDGAQPQLKGYAYLKKPDYALTTEDISMSRPRALHQPLNRPTFSLMTTDIEKAQPSKQEFRTTRTEHNPLNPVYKLASYEIRPITPPRFIQDSINVDDIYGTKPNVYYKWGSRDHINVNDIEGAQPKPEQQLQKPNFTDPSDINKEGKRQFYKGVNPLMPEYKLRDENGELILIGEVEGSKPRKRIPSYDPHNRHLTTLDIERAGPGTVGLGPFTSKQRNHSRNPTDIGDIDGANAGSLKKGISTLRTTHPLDPAYKWQTEDPELQQPKRQEKPEIKTDKEYLRNDMKFWGVTPPTSAAPQQKKEEPPKDPEFTKNLSKFYNNSGTVTPNAQYDANLKNFYSNPAAANNQLAFNSIKNPYTIHRNKPVIPLIDKDSCNFQKNAATFYSDASRAENVAQKPPTGSRTSTPGYQFTLNRTHIKDPGRHLSLPDGEEPKTVKSCAVASQSSSRRSSRLAASAKNVL